MTTRHAGRIHVVLIAAFLAGSLPYASGQQERAAAPTQQQQQAAATAQTESARTFLGFAEGEERAYVMGPPDSLNEGEAAFWSIRLQRIEAGRGVFSIFHERSDPASSGLLSLLERDDAYEDAEYARATGEIHLTGAGFPMEVVFRGSQRFINRTIEYAAEYNYGAGELRWELQHLFDEISENVPVPDELQLHPEDPAGLFLYYGADLRCLGRSSSMQRLADVYNVAQTCDEADLSFANPGLLGIALRMPWPADVETVDLWFLSPLAAWFESEPPPIPGNWRKNKRRETDYGSRPVDEAQHFSRFRFEILGRAEIRIGDRTVPTTQVYIQELAQSFFVDQNGVVVRVNLGQHPATGKPRWIQLRPALRD